jgi:hypothetical protein
MLRRHDIQAVTSVMAYVAVANAVTLLSLTMCTGGFVELADECTGYWY